MSNNFYHEALESDTLDEMTKAFGALIENKQGLIDGHEVRVAMMGYQLAKKLSLPKAKCEILAISCLMHDIGKLFLPVYLFTTEGAYSVEEYAEMKKHTTMGANVFSKAGIEPVKTTRIVVLYHYEQWSKMGYPEREIKGANSFLKIEPELLETARVVTLYHHEQWNGMGYPEGLKGKNIPIEARITSVVDVYDSLLTPRPHRSNWTTEETVNYLMDNRGIIFEPEILDIFLNNIEVFDAIRKNNPDAK